MHSIDTAHDELVVHMLERAASIGVWRLELGGGELSWSRQLAAIHGKPDGYVPPPGDAYRHYTPEFQPRIEQLVRACAVEGAPFDEEAQILLPDGRRSWVRSLGEAVRDDEGRIMAVQGAVQEIAPRGMRPGTLLRMGAALGSGEAFATVDCNGQYSFLNEQA